jgi:PDZ domain/Aspartyl protease
MQLMKKIYLLILFCFPFILSFSQEGFQFKTNKKKIVIPFQLCNNLIVIPIEINGVVLNFLLDTGVEKTVLFTLEGKDSLKFNNVEKIRIKGLGNGNSIDGLLSKENKLKIKNLVDDNHEVYIILDQDINFSSQLGIPIHGIIGYYFMKDYFIEIDYRSRKLSVYRKKDDYSANKLKKFDQLQVSIELEKPYIESVTTLNMKTVNTKVLIDTGGSDALWLFEDKLNIQSPKNNFEDYLGRGFSGNIHGKRSRVEKLQIGNQEIFNPTVSFPDTTSVKAINLVKGRNGSIGSEILRRFDLLFDYENKKIYLKKNSNFDNPFNYNMSGIEIQHNGLQMIKEEVELRAKFVNSDYTYNTDESTNVKYKFSLKPVYEISNVRPNSSAASAGIKKGDVITKINGILAYRYKLQEINDLMQSEEGRWISLEIKRDFTVLKFRIQLRKIL